MSIQPQLTLTDYAGNKSHLSLSQQPLVGYKVRPAIAKDSPELQSHYWAVDNKPAGPLTAFWVGTIYLHLVWSTSDSSLMIVVDPCSLPLFSRLSILMIVGWDQVVQEDYM